MLDATLPIFGLLTSAMHMSWLRHIAGRLKSDYRYSIGLVYNAFPLPQVSKADLQKIDAQAKAVLDARVVHAATPLATLYDPDLMPANLRKAHQALDRAVDILYRKKGFASDRERAEHLFGLYEAMAAPLASTTAHHKRATGKRARR